MRSLFEASRTTGSAGQCNGEDQTLRADDRCVDVVGEAGGDPGRLPRGTRPFLRNPPHRAREQSRDHTEAERGREHTQVLAARRDLSGESGAEGAISQVGPNSATAKDATIAIGNHAL